MNEMILTSKRTPIEIALDIDSSGHTTARKLYSWLELDQSHYNRWIKQNITDNPYAVEGDDYSPLMASEQSGRGNFAQDFLLTASFAKKLAMITRTEKGEQAREYFIRVEKELIREKSKTSIGGPSMNDKLLVVDMAAKMLNLNDASKILMLGKFCKQEGIPSDFLPSYEQNGGRLLIAVSTLLKEFNCELGPVNFNKLLIANGFLEEKTRPSTKDETKIKKFKALTEKAAKYGENQISPQNPREVQPMYYRETFMELYKLVTEETGAEEETE